MPTVDPRDAELAACPFCGSRASLEGVRDGCQVICNGNRREACFARGPVVYHGPGGWDACRAEAIAAWNRRTRPEPLAGSGVAGELERLAAKATPGPWEVDTLKSEGEYGSGPDTTVGYEVSAIYNAKGEALFDALNSDAITVHDEVSDANAKLIVALRNNLPTILQSLRAHPAPDQSAHCSGEVVEGLRIAAGIVESDLCAAEETKDADWEGQSREALDAVNSAIAALSAPRPDEGVESLREIAAQKLPDELDNPEDADWREGYVGCVERARAALSRLTTPEKRP
jgi:hypothetical protein